MKESKFTEIQITKVLKWYEGGRSVEDICNVMLSATGALNHLGVSESM